MSDPSQPPGEKGRVIRFRPRGASPSGWRWPMQRSRSDDAPVADLSKYERVPGDDDYRHRMIVNVLGLTVTLVLVVIGVWLANSISEMRKNQDCVLQGRHNCAQLKIPPAER